ncbi:hypothetical protein MRX96_029021 [Rhipicephalus microplus]
MGGEGPIEVPPDGLCDFIFYDSLGDPFDRLGQQARGPFRKFQSLATKGKMTQFGVSIFPLDVPSVVTLLNRPTSIDWAKEKLWDHNIYHWGILSIRASILKVSGYFVAAIMALAKTDEISKPSPTKRVASYTFLGYYGQGRVSCAEAVEHME